MVTVITEQTKQKILKAVLLLRKCGNKYDTKEQQIHDEERYYKLGWITDDEINEWIKSLKEEFAKTPEQKEAESKEYIEWLMEKEFVELKREEDEYYTPSATAGDYSPSCPWNAPGCSIRDFIQKGEINMDNERIKYVAIDIHFNENVDDEYEALSESYAYGLYKNL